MRSTFKRLLAGAVVALASLGAIRAAALPGEEPAAAPRLRPGMTADEVRQLYGSPQRIARQILHRRFQEMWTYAQPSPLYVEFSAATGQEPRIVTVHSFSSTHK